MAGGEAKCDAFVSARVGSIPTGNFYFGDIDTLSSITTGDNNIAIGGGAAKNVTEGNRSIYLGDSAGYYHTTQSDILIIDNEQRADVAAEIANALIYGYFKNHASGPALTINGVATVKGTGGGGYTEYDLKVGDVDGTPTYGMIQIGNAAIGRTSYTDGIDLDGAVLFRNIAGPVTSEIEFVFAESTGNTCRFALPKSGVGNATYNPRSMLLAGPAPPDTDFVKVSYWQGQGIFDNLACDTAGDGADLGVQNDFEVEGDIFSDSIKESTTGVGVTFGHTAQAPDFAKTGWPISPGVTLSFVNGTRTFTVTDGGSAFYYVDGVKYTLGGNKTVVIDDTEGLWYIYFVGSTLTASQTPWVIRDEDKATVSIMYWDATNDVEIYLGNELHTFHMTGVTHQRLHDAGGTAFEDGLLVSDAGSETVNVDAGEIHDEDLEVDISDGAGGGLFEQILSPAELPVLYRDGASNWRIFETGDKANATDVGYTNGGDLKYNKLNGTWAVVNASAARHVAYWVVATDDQTTPVILIMGQREDTTLANAKENNIFSGLSLSGLPFQEMVLLARLIIKEAAGGIFYTLEEVLDLRGTNIGGNITSPLITDHGGLGGLGDSSDHPWAMLGTGSATDNTLSRFDGTDGRTMQTSGIVVDNSDNMSGVGTLASAMHTIQTSSSDYSLVIEEDSGAARLVLDRTASGTEGVFIVEVGNVAATLFTETGTSIFFEHDTRANLKDGAPGSSATTFWQCDTDGNMHAEGEVQADTGFNINGVAGVTGEIKSVITAVNFVKETTTSTSLNATKGLVTGIGK